MTTKINIKKKLGQGPPLPISMPVAVAAKPGNELGQGPAPPTQHTHSSHGPATTEGYTQPTQGIPLEHPALVARGIVFLGPQRASLILGHSFKTGRCS